MTTQHSNKTASLKRAMSVIVVICMMCGLMIPFGTVTAHADAPTNYTTITADSVAEVNITTAGASQYFEFTPAYSGVYAFYSTEYTRDPYGGLLDADGNGLAYDDDSGDDNNFRIEFECQGNTTYYIQAYFYNSDATGSYTLHVETLDVYCVHEFVLHTAQAPDCENNGVNTYVCSICQETYDEIVPSAGHAYADGYCTVCGAEEPATDLWDGTVDTSWFTNDSYEYVLYTAEELAGLAYLVNDGNNFSDVTIYLGNNIDLSGSEWTPIGSGTGYGTFTRAFSGTFDGMFHTIYGMTITQPSSKNVGLFGAINGAAVQNLALVDAFVEVEQSYDGNAVGALVGIMNNSTVDQVSVSGTVIDRLLYEHICCVGLVIGYVTENGSSRVTNVAATGEVSGYCSGFNSYVGGIVGVKDYSSGSLVVENCFFLGVVNAADYDANSYAGGILGASCGNEQVNNCLFVGQVNSNNYRDAIITNFQTAVWSNCYYYSDFTSDRGYMVDEENLASPDWYENTLGWDLINVWGFGPDGEPVLKEFGGGGYTPHQHVYEETSFTDATCTEDGLVVLTCTECGRTQETVIPAYGHSLEETSRTEATCEQDGIIVVTCTTCGMIGEEVIPAYGHNYENGVCTTCGETMFADAQTVVADSSVIVNIDVANGFNVFEFVPEYDGRYSFYSSNRVNDPYGILLDGEGFELANNDDGYGDYNFQIIYDCTAGETYYILARFLGSATGSYTLNVAVVEIYCNHNYVLESATEADCENDGVETYTCEYCGDSYTEVTEYAYGHSYENGYCVNCGEYIVDIADTIVPDSSVQVVIDVAGGAQYYLFVPTCSGRYTFYSSNNDYDTYGALLDEYGNYLVTNDDSGSGNNFSITYDCEADTVYIIRAYYFGSSSTGTYTLNVQTVQLYCDHNYVLQSATEVGCENDGTETYTCEYCGDSYTEVTEYAYGHSYENGYCVNCGDSLFDLTGTIVADSSVTVTIEVAQGSNTFIFVPEHSGIYRFYSSNRVNDPYGILLDANANQLDVDDDGAGDLNFSITYECIAGETYYIQATFLGTNTGSYTLNLETVELYCDHEYVLQETIPADCTNGAVEVLACAYCGDTVNNTVSDPLGHDYVDAVCTRCGDINYAVLNSIHINAAGGSNYPLFNSGNTTASGWDDYRSNNPAPDTYDNQGYDLHGQVWDNNITRLGLAFTVDIDVTEQSFLQIMAWDVDENARPCGYGYEYDYIYLVDDTDPSATVRLDGHMSGQNNTWNNSEFVIPPSLLQRGHTYHIELEMTCTGNHNCSYYEIIVRTVNLIVNGSTGPVPTPTTGIENAELSASISSSGEVSVDLIANTYADETFTLEYKAVYTSDNAQYGGAQYSVTIPTYGDNFGTYFQLESGSPRGTYEITVFIKNAQGNVVASRTVTVSYGYSAVSYHSNGGSQNLPTDGMTYSSGDTVTVLFDYTPSLYGYTFLGWSTDRYATEPMFTQDGFTTFTIGDSDVVLYAIWALDVCEHEWVEDSYTEPSCTTDGLTVRHCAVCEEVEEVVIPALGHDFVDGVCSRCGATRQGNVLLIEDILPWGRNANSAILQGLVNEGKIEAFDKYSSNDLAVGNVDMFDYALVILAADQNQSFYDNIPIDTLAAYAQSGGSIFLAADTDGHAHGRYYDFPFDIVSHRSSAGQNYIVDATHPMITGVYSDQHVLQNSDMVGSSISHNYFTNYPQNTNVILQNGSGEATLLEFEYGQGLVVVSGLTFECGYDQNWGFVKGYDDIFMHLYSHSNAPGGNPHTHEFVETSRTEATCTADGRIDYTCSCGQTRYTITEALGHCIVTTVEVQVTCTTDGLIVDRCTNDGCDYEKRTVIHGSHDFEITARQEAACETPGYIEYTCSLCGEQNYEYFEGKHNYVESSRVEPQVEVEGSITYTCTYCNDSYVIALPALMPVLKNSAVLLIQDSLPWAEDVNTMLLEALKNRGVVSYYNIINTTALEGYDLSQYGVVFIANDQSSSMYDRLAANADLLENYVMAGGNLIYGACDQGWGGGGSLSHALPGGVTTSNYYSVHNYIVNELHPIVTGVYTDNRSLRDELLKGNYCSHTYFDVATLPEGTDVILRDANGNPTLVEYKIGNGTVMASGLTWEYFYVRDHYDMVINYSKNAYDDLVTYMVYMSNTCEHEYEIVETVEANCEQNGYTKYLCTICGYEYMTDIVIAPGHDYVETSRTEATCNTLGEIVYTCECGDVKVEPIDYTEHVPGEWYVDIEATCAPGSQHLECAVCASTIEVQEIAPVAEHVAGDWIIDAQPTAVQTGMRHKECVNCFTIVETEIMPILAKLVIENVEVGAGHTVRVTIDIQNNPGIIGALLTLHYDPALTLISAEAGSAWNTLNFTRPASYTNPCNFVWDGVNGADFSNGSIIVLTFEVPADAAVGTVYSISASYTYGNMINADLEFVDLEIEAGSITVVNTLGDVNCDGVVDVADVVTLRRYLVGGYDVVIDQTAADMDCDGYITVTDVVLLRRFLVG